MKVFQIDGNVYGFQEDGTVYMFDEGLGRWHRLTGGPNSPENEARAQRLSEFKG